MCTADDECLNTAYQQDCSLQNGGDANCWTCYNPMCMSCTSNAVNSCTSCHDFTTNVNGVCTCPEGGNPMKRCYDCPGECETCLGDNSPYNDIIFNCSACKTNAYDLSTNAAYKYCVESCPTGFDPVDPAKTCNYLYANQAILYYEFNIPLTTYSSLGQITDGYDLTATGAVPAIYRGIYIWENNAVITMETQVNLNHSWSIHTWIMLMKTPEAGDFFTIFSKDKYGTSGNASDKFIRCGIDSTGPAVDWNRDKSYNTN